MRISSRPGLSLLAVGMSFSLLLSGCSEEQETTADGGSGTEVSSQVSVTEKTDNKPHPTFANGAKPQPNKPHPTFANGAKPQPNAPHPNPPGANPVAPADNQEQPAGGAIIRLTGTVRTLGYQEVLDLQGIDNPNEGMIPPQFTLSVLDSPAQFAAKSVSDFELHTRSITMIGLPLGYQGNKYEGQHLTVDFDTTGAVWPAGTDLPYGQPGLDGFQVVS